MDSPPRRVASPIEDRQSRSLEVVLPRPTIDSGFPSPSTEANMEELARRRQQREELERQQQEQAFRERELELEMRTRELERDRAHLLSSRNNEVYSDTGHTASDTQSNDAPQSQRRFSQFDLPTPATSRGRFSYSTTHLVPPSTSYIQFPNSQSQPPSPANNDQSSTKDHADFCGCATCSVSKYNAKGTPSPHDLRPLEPPVNVRPEKPKGWIRRLSMGNAFSLDPKKSNSSLKNGLTSPAGEDGRMRRSFEQGGIGHQNLTNAGRR
jgi:hypothetical protein